MTALRVIIGVVVGFALAFGTWYLVWHFALNAAGSTTLVIALICGVVGGLYSAVAFGRDIYALQPLSLFGYVLDMTWSLLNTAAALIVWLPACLIAGGNFIEPDDRSRRSGTFVYQNNPRGGGYAATTIGTVIAGGWSSHEECHVWQARMFGPLYLPVYLLSLLLNIIFRLCTGKTEDLTMQAYYRVCFEDWAYSAGSVSGDAIHWTGWFLWLFLSLVYVGTIVLVVVGAMAGVVLLSVFAAVGLIAYSLIRALVAKTG